MREKPGSVVTVSIYPKGAVCFFPGLMEYPLVTLMCCCPSASLKDLTSSWGVKGREQPHGHNHCVSAV